MVDRDSPSYQTQLNAALLPVVTTATRHYVWVSPRSDGFSDQLITIYQALVCARATNRTLVLQQFFSNVLWDTKPSGPYPFEDYFDLGPLKALDVPVSQQREQTKTSTWFKTIRIVHMSMDVFIIRGTWNDTNCQSFDSKCMYPFAQCNCTAYPKRPLGSTTFSCVTPTPCNA